MSQRVPELAPESNGFGAGEYTAESSEIPKTYLHVWALPHYHKDNRFDPRARGDLITVLPDDEDFDAKLKSIAPPGFYAVEKRRGGRIVDRWALEIKPDVRTLDTAPAPASASPSASGLTAEGVASIVAKALEMQWEMFTKEVAALREEVRAQPQQNPTQAISDAVELVTKLRALGAELPPAHPEGKGPKLSEEDQLTLAIAKKSSLLPGVLSQLTQAVASVQDGAPVKVAFGDRLLNLLENNPYIQARAFKTWDRVVDRLLPSNEDGDSMTQEERVDALLTYLMEKCSANQTITFEDEPINEFIEAEPELWEMLLGSMAAASVPTIIKKLSADFPQCAEVLATEHAPGWILINLKKPAAAWLQGAER